MPKHTIENKPENPIDDILEHITGNMYILKKGAKIIGTDGQIVEGPAQIRTTEFDGVDLISLQCDSMIDGKETRLEIKGKLEKSVHKIPSSPESSSSKK